MPTQTEPEEETSQQNETEEAVDEFLSDYGPGNDTEALDDQASTQDVQEAAREAEEEGQRYDEMQEAEPADEAKVEQGSEEAQPGDDSKGSQEGPDEDVEPADEEEASQEQSEDEAGEAEEEDLDVELDDDLTDILGGDVEQGREQEQETEEEPETPEYVQRLEEKVNELESRLEGEGGEEVRTPDEPETQEKLQFINNEEDLQEAFDDPEQFNDLMSRVFHTLREEVTRVVPEIARQTYRTEREVRDKVKSFWKENPDLQEWETQVQAVAQEVQAQNPNASPSTVLQKSGEIVRERLELSKKAKETEEETSNSSAAEQPPTPGGSGSGPPTSEDLSEEEEEIGQLLDATESRV